MAYIAVEGRLTFSIDSYLSEPTYYTTQATSTPTAFTTSPPDPYCYLRSTIDESNGPLTLATTCDGRPVIFQVSEHEVLTMTYGSGVYMAEGIPTTVKSHKQLLLSIEECEAKLSACQETSMRFARGNVSGTVETVSLETRSKRGEDRLAVDLISSADVQTKLAKMLEEDKSLWEAWAAIKRLDSGNDPDFLLCSVMDGHGGAAVAKLLAATLHPWIAKSVIASGCGDENMGFQANQQELAQKLKEAFVSLDDDITKQTEQAIIGSQATSPALVGLKDLISSGACALTAVIDLANFQLYASQAGDCCLVLGSYDPFKKAWSCAALTNDQNCDNAQEVERLQQEHPGEENDVVHDRGDLARILGVLQPSRAFGDTEFKRRELQNIHLQETIKEPCAWKDYAKPNNSPPYVTAEPEVSWRSLKQKTGKERRHVVIQATDGFWNRISSYESIQLAAAHSEPLLQSSMSKIDAAKRYPNERMPGDYTFPFEPLPATTKENSKGDWMYQDANTAKHLLRASIGRGNPDLMRMILSLDDEVSRYMRDDTTIVVVRFDNDDCAYDESAGSPMME